MVADRDHDSGGAGATAARPERESDNRHTRPDPSAHLVDGRPQRADEAPPPQPPAHRDRAAPAAAALSRIHAERETAAQLPGAAPSASNTAPDARAEDEPPANAPRPGGPSPGTPRRQEEPAPARRPAPPRAYPPPPTQTMPPKPTTPAAARQAPAPSVTPAPAAAPGAGRPSLRTATTGAVPAQAAPPPVEARPAEARPVEARPAETRPVEARPLEAWPAETRPAEARPPEAWPAEERPVQARPVEARPVEAPDHDTERRSIAFEGRSSQHRADRPAERLSGLSLDWGRSAAAGHDTVRVASRTAERAEDRYGAGLDAPARRSGDDDSAAAHPLIGVLHALADAEARTTGRAALVARAAHALAVGMVDPGAIEALDLERELIATIRLPQHQPRVVAVVAGQGGAGTTTTAAGIALTLAALRDDATVLADARSGGGSLSARLAGRPGPGLRAVAAGARGPAPFVTGAGLRTVDGASPGEPLDPQDVRAAVEELTAAHTFTLLDVGNDLSAAAQEAMRLADQVVIVTPPTEDGFHSARLVLDRLAELGLDDWVLATLALVRAHPGGQRRPRPHLLRSAGAEAVFVPLDQYLGSGGRLDATRLRPATRQAYLALAALIAGAHTQR